MYVWTSTFPLFAFLLSGGFWRWRRFLCTQVDAQKTEEFLSVWCRKMLLHQGLQDTPLKWIMHRYFQLKKQFKITLSIFIHYKEIITLKNKNSDEKLLHSLCSGDKVIELASSLLQGLKGSSFSSWLKTNHHTLQRMLRGQHNESHCNSFPLKALL